MLAIGIDAGGSKVAVGLIDTATGEVLREATVPTPPRPEADVRLLADVAAAVLALGADASLPVGLGICELVSLTGEVVSGHRIGWTRAEVLAAFPQAARLVIAADVRAAAIAEARLGAGRSLECWLYANAGTGVALVPMQGDRPWAGAQGRALALGVSPADLTPEGDGRSIEDFAGGAGLLARARRAGLDCSGTADLMALAEAGGFEGEMAARIMTEGGAVFGGVLALAVNALDPAAIVLGGGVVLASTPYRAAMQDAYRTGVWYSAEPPPPLRDCALGGQAGLIGAALCAV